MGGVILLLIGAYLIAKTASSNNGTVLGWVLLAIGIFAILTAIGFVTGVYRD